MSKEFRIIPGYETYAVSESGIVVNTKTSSEVRQYLLNGYAIVDAFYGSRTETLPVHRAVALAWVSNPDPSTRTMVNHIDGNTINNWYGNLEWVTCSENNYHAVNSGLRSDNICCTVRDFETGVITPFNSMSQAAEFMGLNKATTIHQLLPKKFGALVAGRYEVRQEGDDTPWFYESRTEKVSARYQVVVTDSTGNKKEIYSTGNMLKELDLYKSPTKAIPGLAEYARLTHPDKQIEVNDSYALERNRVHRPTRRSFRMGVVAENGSKRLEFSSISDCARNFGVDRSTIMNRLDSEVMLDGWKFKKSLSA